MNKIRGIAMLAALVLTARLGRIQYENHAETWYDLNMSKVVVKAHNNGIDGAYWIDDKGLKRLGEYVMCAGHPDRYGEVIETSLGVQGIIVDTGDFAKTDPTAIDIATNWKKGEQK